MTIGLTGGIGSGKSTVAAMFEAMGYPVFYSDQAAKAIMRNDPNVQEAIIQQFGENAYQNGELNRQWLAQRIFSQPEEKEFINYLVHPLVRNAFSEFAHNQTSPLVFNEAAILFETGGNFYFDKTILVVAPSELRIARVMKRDACTRENVENRMNNQWADEQKIPLADHVIVNDDAQPLLQQIEKLIDELTTYSTSS